MNKKILLPVAALAIAGAVAFSTKSVLADTISNDPLVNRIAERFDLQESEVQAVFDEAHQQRQQEMQARMAGRLDQAVADGQLTAEQKALLLAKMQEHHAEREANGETFGQMSPGDRRAQAESHRQEMHTWAEANGITLPNLMMGSRSHGSAAGPHF